MIDIIDKNSCCGCEACRQICPVQCIEMQEDDEGFLYPEVVRECIGCGKCLSACPIHIV